MTGATEGVAGPAARPNRLDVWTVALIGLPLVVALVLLAFVAADPAIGVTSSNGPFTDESWDVMNARNFVLLGSWATDDWTLHLVNLPFSLSTAAVFSVLGVGIVQARLVSIAATAVTVAALGLGLRRTLGSGPAMFAALAFGGATLVLYYGRLAFLEPSVAMWLTLGALTILRMHGGAPGRWGIVGGVLLALAVGTKPSAAAAVVGLLAAVAVVGMREPGVRRWVGGAALAIAALGGAWAAVIWLPNRVAISNVLSRIGSFPARNDGFIGQSIPILAVGTAGLAFGVARWRQLSTDVRLLLAASAGWAAAGLALLVVAPYRPNRYEEPLLPAFALLAGIGARVAADLWADRSRRLVVMAGAALAIVLVAPGLASYAGWMRGATYRLPGLQAQTLAALPAGGATQGTYAPAFAMRARVLTIVSRPAVGVSPGDLYATRDVRWFFGEGGEAPVWASLHPAAWAARETVLCSDWGTTHVCLYHLP
jgi:4-amino-4-deoxy-L-arabinose transferase-like glycosyltransferase